MFIKVFLLDKSACNDLKFVLDNNFQWIRTMWNLNLKDISMQAHYAFVKKVENCLF